VTRGRNTSDITEAEVRAEERKFERQRMAERAKFAEADAKRDSKPGPPGLNEKDMKALVEIVAKQYREGGNFICRMPGCKMTARARGICTRHYNVGRRLGLFGPKCKAPRCERGTIAYGYCDTHFARMRGHGGATKPCSVAGCEYPSRAHGLCNVHRLRQYRKEQKARMR